MPTLSYLERGRESYSVLQTIWSKWYLSTSFKKKQSIQKFSAYCQF